MTRKILSLLLVTVMLVSLLAACSGNNDGADTETSKGESSSSSEDKKSDSGEKEETVKPITYSVFIGAPGQQPAPDNKIFKMIEEEFGITFEFEFLVGDLEQRLGVMIASGDYPDIISGANDTQKLIDAGAFIPIQDMINSQPNLQAHYDGYMEKMKADDGNVYVMPNYGRIYNEYVQTSYYGPGFWIQKAVLKELGYPEIKTLDQYFDAIQEYMALHPEIDGQPTIGFEALSYDWRSFCLRNAPAQLMGYPNDGGVLVDADSHEAQIYANHPDAKIYYEKLNGMYHAGVIQADTFVQNYDEYLARLSTGAVLGMFDQGWQFQSATESLISQGKIDRTWVPLGITYDESIVPYYRDRPPLNIDRGYGISVDCEEPERFMEMVNAFTADEWQKIFSWGIEGEDYLVDEDGMYYRTEEQRLQQEDVAWKLSNKAYEFFEELPKKEGTFDDGNAFTPGQQASEYIATLKDIDKEVLEAYGKSTFTEFLGEAPENRKDYPAWQISLGDGTDAAIADQKLTETQMKWLPQLILGSSADFGAGWDTYMSEFDGIDIAAYEARVNEGIQERLAEW